MIRPFSRRAVFAVLAASVACASAPRAQAAAPAAQRTDVAAPASTPLLLKNGDVLAVVGDSITEQKRYSVMIEAYLDACTPLDVRIVGCGWSGDTCGWFLGRHQQDIIGDFHPTVATTCFGMNDGGYRAPDPKVIQTYHDGMINVVNALKAQGIDRFVIGGPGAVDPATFRHNPEAAKDYNETLTDLTKEAKAVAAQFGAHFTDVHAPMIDIMKESEAKYGHDYNVAGGDGVHPADNGHLIMAYAFLKGLGLDGDVGTITLNAGSGTATATAGHTVDSATATSVTLTSTRYPFCFYGDPAKPDATTGMLAYLPFNQDLNRFTLVVTGLKGDAKVTFGNESKQFTADELAKGINLANFIDNPFREPFRKVLDAARAQENAETTFYKGLLPGLGELEPTAKDQGTDAEKALKTVSELVDARDKQLSADAKQAVVPVKYTITVQPVGQ